MELVVIKLANGSLVAADKESAEELRKIKTGVPCRVALTRIRNYEFLKKFMALVKVGFELWCEHRPTPSAGTDYARYQPEPNFKRFRKDLTIMCGYYDAVYNIKGELRLEAKSISFANMQEDEFEQLYSKAIDVILHKVIPQAGLDEQTLQQWVERTLEFA